MGKTFRQLSTQDRRAMKSEIRAAGARTEAVGRSQVSVEAELKGTRRRILAAQQQLDEDMRELMRYGVTFYGGRMAGGDSDVQRTELYKRASRRIADLQAARAQEARLLRDIAALTDRSARAMAKAVRGQYRK